ncbi:hypothetical protein Tdes44962_MAKER09430 [Teratosphaeria destructans]|uniref:Uncharacterized protein n=1 Tax=Teratosphaeria destructans TaxID=418781 RepID=A0A9W7ST04_9PEZI|nr:hypothetical protein Tdes44962_MAKER09430 [Teratosphaeria destructans]
MAEEATDQFARDVPLRLGLVLGRREACEDGVVRDAPRQVGLRVEEDLRVRHAVGGGVFEVVGGQGLEVGGVDQDVHPDVVVVEEIIEGVESMVALHQGVGGFEGRIVGGQGDSIPLRELEQHLGGQGPFQVCIWTGRNVSLMVFPIGKLSRGLDRSRM